MSEQGRTFESRSFTIASDCAMSPAKLTQLAERQCWRWLAMKELRKELTSIVRPQER